MCVVYRLDPDLDCVAWIVIMVILKEHSGLSEAHEIVDFIEVVHASGDN